MNVTNELKRRAEAIRQAMRQKGIDAAIICCNVNLIYTFGQVVNGYLYLPAAGEMLTFIKRPNTITGTNIYHIRKPEQIADTLRELGIAAPKVIMLESDELTYTEHTRMAGIFPRAEVVNGTSIIRRVRTIKTPYEIELLKRSAQMHANAYRRIPSVFKPGMDDFALGIEIERLMRLEGCLGIFRVFGQSMEIFMGSLLAGSNAETPSPYDFALGGEGLDGSLPVGLNRTKLEPGTAIMVDYGGNFLGYMHDLTRVFSVGRLDEKAYRAHQVCLEIQDKVISLATPGTPCEELYDAAIELAATSGFADHFMGTKQQARFIGHGIGLEINEAPVLAPRVKQVLEPGMVFALEPKIVLPGIGAVGIENSWVVTDRGSERLNDLSDEVVELG